MTPKSLLRLPAAASPLSDLSEGRFQPVLDDQSLPGTREDVTRLVLCTGKVYYDLVNPELREHAPTSRSRASSCSTRSPRTSCAR